MNPLKKQKQKAVVAWQPVSEPGSFVLLSELYQPYTNFTHRQYKRTDFYMLIFSNVIIIIYYEFEHIRHR